MGLPLAVVRRKAVFWVNLGVLTEARAACLGDPASGGAAHASGCQATGGGIKRAVVYRRAAELDPALHGAQ